jgi:hypothetical protein
MRKLFFLCAVSFSSLRLAAYRLRLGGRQPMRRSPLKQPKPLIKWLSQTNDLRSKGAIDFGSPAEFAVDANLDSNCRLSHVVIEQKAGDRKLYPVVESLFAAIGDAGLLSLLGNREGQDVPADSCVSTPVRFTFKSDAAGVDVTASYAASSPDRALGFAKAYELLIQHGRRARRGQPDEQILEGLSATSEAQRLIIHFHTSREKLDSLITRLLQSQ